MEFLEADVYNMKVQFCTLRTLRKHKTESIVICPNEEVLVRQATRKYCLPSYRPDLYLYDCEFYNISRFNEEQY